jgi:hypothetical protein
MVPDIVTAWKDLHVSSIDHDVGIHIAATYIIYLDTYYNKRIVYTNEARHVAAILAVGCGGISDIHTIDRTHHCGRCLGTLCDDALRRRVLHDGASQLPLCFTVKAWCTVIVSLQRSGLDIAAVLTREQARGVREFGHRQRLNER